MSLARQKQSINFTFKSITCVGGFVTPHIYRVHPLSLHLGTHPAGRGDPSQKQQERGDASKVMQLHYSDTKKLNLHATQIKVIFFTPNAVDTSTPQTSTIKARTCKHIKNKVFTLKRDSPYQSTPKAVNILKL